MHVALQARLGLRVDYQTFRSLGRRRRELYLRRGTAYRKSKGKRDRRSVLSNNERNTNNNNNNSNNKNK